MAKFDQTLDELLESIKNEAGEKWMQGAVKRPGALRAKAKSMGLISGDETLSASDLNTLDQEADDTDNSRLKKQVTLARTFKKAQK